MRKINLSERQKIILGLVIQEFVEKAQPIGSKFIVDQYKLDFSSATVRNELSILAEEGLLRQPHTSAGRIPTEEGYRYFVQELMRSPDLPYPIRQTISHQFYQAGKDMKKSIRLASSILANQARGAAIVTAPFMKETKFKHIELISTMGKQALMVLVLMSGKVIQNILILKESISQEKLSETSTKINQLCHGKELKELSFLPETIGALGNDIWKIVQEDLQRNQTRATGEIFQDGWSNMLKEPEFSDSETARKTLQILEEGAIFEELFSQTMMNLDIGGVQVLIGGEGYWEELKDCSIVMARYGHPEAATGIMGVLGPIRMSYRNAISTVHYVAEIMSELVTEMLEDEIQLNQI